MLACPWLHINAAGEICAVRRGLDDLRFGDGVAHHSLELNGHFGGACMYAKLMRGGGGGGLSLNEQRKMRSVLLD